MASYKDLADLVFPDVKEKEYYEEKYPRRNLPEGAMVLRVAPSPTGNKAAIQLFKYFKLAL